MRPSDETFFNLKRLHLVFAVSSAALLAATVWMLAADHWRPWRTYQRTYREQVEPWGTSKPAPGLAQRLLGAPIIDALGRTLKIDQIWLPQLTIDYNFRQVARFDRCTTCHQGIDSPRFPRAQTLSLKLAVPSGAGQGGAPEKACGFALAERGVLDAPAPTVGQVAARAPAAMARLKPGDRFLRIDGREVPDKQAAGRELSDAQGKTVALDVCRGLAQPYAAHPRLDLFLGDHSPHPLGQFGCTICHDGQGSGTDFTFAAHTPNSPEARRDWRDRYGWSPGEHWDFPMLAARFTESRCVKCHHAVTDLEPSRRFPDPPAPKLLAGYNRVRELGCFGCHEINGYDDTGRSVGPDLRLEPKGTLRKVGPALRDVGQRLDAAFLADHMAQPARFRPSTRMPQLFGLDEHLEGQALDDTRRLEAVEIRAVTEYLLDASRSAALARAPAGVTEAPSAERGKRLFPVQGCLACHKHEAFPDGQAVVGPELSRLGAKYTTAAAYAWLTSWIRNPAHHAPRTAMPNPLLEPVALPAEQGRGAKPLLGDPAADLAAWLVTSADWEPQPLVAPAPADVDLLAAQYPKADLARLSPDKRLHELGRLTIRKRGCFGCHEIGGLEDAQPIGPALTDWGRKQISLLAFEQVDQFVKQQPIAGGDAERRTFFRQALLDHRREGFLWQKLGAPRSFDYKRALTKSFNEQLLMGHFPLSDEDREAIITFVLGLVAQPPGDRYVYQPGPRQRAIVEGRKLIDQYGCAECHTLEMERWTIEYDPARFTAPPPAPDYAFLKPDLGEAALAASLRPDARGLARAELVGMPRVDANGRWAEDEDDDGNPLYAFTLWEPAALAGHAWSVGGADVLVSKSQLVARLAPWGGNFARLLYPIALAEARASGSTAARSEAWGWVPPALAQIGRAVQPQWMYDFLLAPRAIRPAAVLRMPKYNLSPDEARKLTDYFAALSGAEFPYAAQSGAPPATAAEEQARLARCDRAMKFLVDRTTYCAKCHLVGDYGPGGENRTILAPALDNVGRRIRPEYLRRWLANPKSALPYTAMPVNFPPAGAPLGQDLYPGTSLEQLDAVMELLLNYDWHLSRRTSVRRMAEGER